MRAAARQLSEIGRHFGVGNIRVFGSVARGDATPASDLDLVWAACTTEVPRLASHVRQILREIET